MPPRNKRWEGGRKKPRTRRVRRILILCEDTKSSRDYLERFRVDENQVQIECVGTGMNTDRLMEEAIKRKMTARDNGNHYEKIWVVFDKDDFSLQNFNRAFDLARSHSEIVACWSNECFELWYLLHFCYRDTGISRKDVWPEVSKCLGQKYDKADDSVFEQLEAKIEEALQNAKRLAFENGTGAEQRRNPSTRAHELVEALRALDPHKQQ